MVRFQKQTHSVTYSRVKCVLHIVYFEVYIDTIFQSKELAIYEEKSTY